jgi:hypothetical protein
MCFIIWIILIVLCKIDSCSIHCCSLLKVLNQNLNLKFHQMNFWFEFLDIHMNEKPITCHDCHGFKWQNINIYSILIYIFVIHTLFGSLDCDYTHLKKPMICLFMVMMKFLLYESWIRGCNDNKMNDWWQDQSPYQTIQCTCGLHLLIR